MTIIESKKIKDLFFLNLMYEIHRVSEKLKLFELKYMMSFSGFENKITQQSHENFPEWDDYMEWKACQQMKDKYDIEKKDIADGNFNCLENNRFYLKNKKNCHRFTD